MDPEVSLLLQCPPGGLPERQVRAELSPDYDRRRPLPGGDQAIAAVWETRIEAQPWLFDAPKFRLHSAALVPTGPQGPELLLRLGLTSYRDFLGTNWASSAAWLRQQGAADWGDEQAYLADPLGVGAALTTADDFLVFLRRSQQVAEAPGLVDVPGGHPEPQEELAWHFSANLCSRQPLSHPLIPSPDLSEAREWGKDLAGPLVHLEKEGLGKETTKTLTVPQQALRISNPLHKDLPGELVVHEIFSRVLQEISDEVNLPQLTLSQPLLLGIVRNETSAGRASAEFYVQCSLTSEQVRKDYMSGGPEAHESTEIIFVEARGLYSAEGSEAQELWAQLLQKT